MLEIKGKVNTAICYATVIEDEAIEQIRRMCDYEFTAGSKVRIMPDVHAGKGCTIGTTMTVIDKAVPNVVGVDIGCGMYAWGWEPCTIAEIKQYKPSSNSLGSGQVLHCPYESRKAKLIVKEMADLLVLDLVDKALVTDQIVLTVGYDIENLSDPKRRSTYKGPVTTDHYGSKIPKHAHGTANLDRQTSSSKLITDAVLELYDRIVDPTLLIRRLNLAANHVVAEDSVKKTAIAEQMDLFTDYEALEKQRQQEEASLEREKKMQQAVLSIKKKFGKNAILKGMNLEEGATTKARNEQIGGHKA